MADTPEVPDVAALFPDIPPELQAFAESMRTTMVTQVDHAYETGVITGMKACVDFLHKVGMHDTENLLRGRVAPAVLDTLEEIQSERRG